MTPLPYDLAARLFQIGTRPLDPAHWLEPDNAMAAQLAEKARLRQSDGAAIFAQLPASRPAQAELLEMLVDYLPAHFPHIWRREGAAMRILPSGASLPLHGQASPLMTAMELVQDDLLLLQRDEQGWRLTAGALAFPSSWVLAEKMGQVLDAIHGPVPGFGPGTRPAQIMARMFDAARPETPMLRWNFSLYGDARLHHPDNIAPDRPRFGTGEKPDPVFLRVERQTLRKLPRTGAMAFTIRLSLFDLDTLERHPQAGRIAAALAGQIEALSPDQLRYKGLAQDRDPLLARLAAMANGQGEPAPE